MEIIPSINCDNFHCVIERMDVSEEIFDKRGVFDPWVHIDIADGTFTNGYQTWTDLGDLKGIERNFKIEMHIMATEPMYLALLALEQGVARVIVHIESDVDIRELSRLCKKAGTELMLGVNYSSELRPLYPLLKKKIAKSVLVLSVPAGLSGQGFQRKALEKVKKLRTKYPKMLIEVDGGVNPLVVRECMEAGAENVVAGAFIFGEDDPVKAYTELKIAA
jgi:ribulose-phosphate 3-epimerase